jgi:pteridine reductase
MASSNSLSGKVALVTGAARRIGAVIARTLHAEGADVAIHYRGSDKAANAVANELEAERPGSAAAFCADLTDLSSLNSLAADVIAWRGQLDILVNNASTFYPTPPGEITEEQWDDLVGTNLKAPLFLSQALLPALREARGAIINIVDVHAQRPLRNHTVYGPAKAGLAMLTRSLAKDLAPEIRVNGVSPGAILWPESDMSDDTKHAIVEQIPLGRAGTPEDIASAVLFLASEASYVTGQIIAIDGGRSIGW